MRNVLVLLFVTLFFQGCFYYACGDISIPDDVACIELKHGILMNEWSYVRTTIDSICFTLPVMPTEDDPLGHHNNTMILLDNLQGACAGLEFELDCYACMESLPVQSSIKVVIDSMGFALERNFSLYVPEGDFMYF